MATMTVDAAGHYQTVFSGTPATPDDVGVLELAKGRWTAVHQAGWTDRGTYRFEGANVLIIEGVGPDARWRRISGGESPASPRPSTPATRTAPASAATLDPALAHPKPQPIDPAVDRIYQRADAAYKAHDYAGALPDMREAARRGSPKAQNVLGMMYEDGHGVPKDLAQARALYEQSAKQGYRAAQYALGLLYEDGLGVPKKPAMAAALIRLAADQQLGVAEAELGMLYELGEGVPRDRSQAVLWLRKAGSQGDGRAQWIADWLAKPSTPHFSDEMQLANYIDTQVAAYYSSKMPAASSNSRTPTSSYQCQDNNVQLRWQATCDALKREGR